MSETGCPVCGYPHFREHDASGAATYDLCPSCSFEAGVDGIGWDRETRNATFRRRWLEDRGGAWWSTARTPPPGWNATDQLRAAGLLDTNVDDPGDEAE